MLKQQLVPPLFSASSTSVPSSESKASGALPSSFLRSSRMFELHSESCLTDASSAKELAFYQQESTMQNMMNSWVKASSVSWFHGGMEKNWIEDLGRVRTKPRDCMALGMPYDERVNKGRSQLLGGYFEPVLFSNKMHWFHLDRVLVGDIADAWVPELAPRYGDHKLNWWMITQNLALNCST